VARCKRATIRIGEGAGYSGAWLEPAVNLARHAELDYLTFECLAERTIALDQLARRRDPSAGYDPLLQRRLRAVLAPCQSAGTRILTNAGAANPAAAGDLALTIARELGLRGLKLGIISGDDLAGRADLAGLVLQETGRPLSELGDRLVSLNVYLGAEPLVQALAAGADLVIAGRVADPSLTVAALRHAFEWDSADWHRLGAGTAIGHLLECGPQVTGGYFAEPGRHDVPDLAGIGYPIAACSQDGTATITKLPDTGGIVSVATCSEQILYEIDDPAAYLTPDVTADFSHVTFEPVGPDQIRVRGATGRPAPASLKVTVGYRDGFVGEGQISYGGRGCVARARLAADVAIRRLDWLGILGRERRVDLIGYDSLFGPGHAPAVEPPEVRLRLTVRTNSLEEADAVGREVEALWITGPAGGGGATRSAREILAVGSAFVPRETVSTEVTILTA
jgi:hypothetical protein